ncbi:ATP-grasp domain-containing protein [bacterium]|nr:MAG: ATP-grasp domain-containing protein [bacterium]
MDKVLPEKIRIDPQIYYFLYVGEIKAIGLNHFMSRPFQDLYGKPVEFIGIVPDVLAQYPHENIMVINSEARDIFQRTGRRHNVRISVGQFAREVSQSQAVSNLLDRILDNQGELYINVFESRGELSLTDDERVRLIGPDPDLGNTFNNKLIQYQMASNLGIPIPSGRACNTLAEAMQTAETFLKAGYQVFVSGEYSAAGSNSIIANSTREILHRFPEPDEKLLVTRYVEHGHDPTVLGLVAGEEDVYIASVADQNVEGTRFRGSTYPTVLDPETVHDLVEMTRTIGLHLGSQGYRGAFGCDYIVDHNGEIFFIEINARKQGTTMETTLTMAHNLPGHPFFPELEYYAATEQGLPAGVREMDPANSCVSWGTFNYKTDRDVLVTCDVDPMMPEQELFSNVVHRNPPGDGYIVEDHVGCGTTLYAGGFLCRIVAASDALESVHRSLRTGIERVTDTIRDKSA